MSGWIEATTYATKYVLFLDRQYTMIYDLMELKINNYWFFYRLIPEGGLPSENPASVKKVIFCTGKVYYDLTKARAAGELESDIAISRVEQICPFPFDLGTYIKFIYFWEGHKLWKKNLQMLFDVCS